MPMIFSIQQFFAVNSTIVYFVYGLVFFTMGIAIVLQSRRHSRLELARGIGWLAAFGLVHGVYEWGAIFIPIQAAYLAVPAVAFLQMIHVALLALSYAFLYQFGVEMLRRRWPKLLAVPLILVAVWMLVFVMPGLALIANHQDWHQASMIWARYLIGLPASIIAAIGLRYQADQYIKPWNLGNSYRALRLAGFSLLAYAFFGGLVVPPGSFFPSNWLNELNLMQWTGIPVPIFRSLTGLILAVSIIRALEVFDVEVDRIIEKMEVERSLALERVRIGRELHDSTIQTIYTAGLLIQSARQKLPKEDLAAQRLERSMAVLNEAIAGLRAYIDELRPSQAEQGVSEAIHALAGDARWASLVDVKLELDLPPETALTAPRLQHVLAILNEALSNAARHAQAHQVIISTTGSLENFVLSIQDDGAGFQEHQDGNGTGYGLRNMRDRARLLGGTLTITAKPGYGTLVKLTAPWEVEE